MKRKLDLGAVIALMLMVATVTWLVADWQITARVNEDLTVTNRIAKEFEKVKQAKQYIESSFIGSWDEEKLLDGAVAGMIDSLGDKWSTYLNAEDFQYYMSSSANKYMGIGVSVMYNSEYGGIQITEVHTGSPAYDAGIRPNDVIIAIGGQKVTDMGYPVAIEAIRGEVNTTVSAELYRPSENKNFSAEMTRREVLVEPVRAQIIEGSEIGLVRIRNFDTGTDIAFTEAVTNLQNAGVKGIVFDVRANPGGQLQVMLPMLDMLLPEGVLFRMREKSGAGKVSESDANSVRLPMMVLVNESSYSAAEFFAAALKEYEWAEIVGQPTTGKGYAQVPLKLDDGSGIILSTNEYFTPQGKSLADVGLTPDYQVALTNEQAAQIHLLTPEQDLQVAKAVEVLKAKLAPPVEPAAEQTEGEQQG